MRTVIAADRQSMGTFAASEAAKTLRSAIDQRGEARIVVATGSSQFEVLDHLTRQEDIDWPRVTGFHLDEYIGISAEHPASFCGYLKQRFVDRVPLKAFHYLPGDQDPEDTIRRVGGALTESTVDVALVGIGENGHLAFNDPPADFDAQDPYLIVELDEACRRQQVGEGWFSGMDDVPTRAISMSIRQIMSVSRILCSVPDERKATAVRRTLEETISPTIPASILRRHQDATLIADQAAAGQLSENVRSQATIVS